jgi:Zn-dependent protease
MTTSVLATAGTCRVCQSELAAGLLVCPGCGALVHAARLKELAALAGQAAASGDAAHELRAWRDSLALLPTTSTQHAVIVERMGVLSRQIETTPTPAPSGRWKWLAPLGPLGALLWKSKILLVALASKGKLLLLGLTKASTAFSMLLSFGVYWTQWGGWFALGVVLSIYVHEMGHVAALRQYGIAASAPMFIPGFGALVRLRQAPLNRREDARIGLAGPIWGSAAAIAAFAVGYAGASRVWIAIAHTAGWLNLFNLLPVWQLDGNRGFASLTRTHRAIATAVLAGAWFLSRDGLLILLAFAAVIRTMTKDAADETDDVTLATYIGLVAVLTLLIAAARPA